MAKKVNLFHREIEVRVLLEVLAVYVVLASVLVGIYYLEPNITGFAIATEQINGNSVLNIKLDNSEEIITIMMTLGIGWLIFILVRKFIFSGGENPLETKKSASNSDIVVKSIRKRQSGSVKAKKK